MAQLYSTGPAHWWVSLQNSPLLYLGTCEKKPKIVVRPSWSPAYNDLGGQKIPFDMSYQGTEGISLLNLTRFNEPVYQLLATRPSASTKIASGINVPGDIGTLLLTEGLAWTVYVYFPYAAKLAYKSGGMVPGYRFPASYLEGPDEFEPSTDPINRTLIFHHLRAFDPKTGIFDCYDFLLPTMPPIN
jgi:hypothetical protein